MTRAASELATQFLPVMALILYFSVDTVIKIMSSRNFPQLGSDVSVGAS
jgi:hypothetical protein